MNDSAKSGNNAPEPNAIGAGPIPLWRVFGEKRGQLVTRRIIAETSDRAIAAAHSDGIRVDTCVRISGKE